MYSDLACDHYIEHDEDGNITRETIKDKEDNVISKTEYDSDGIASKTEYIYDSKTFVNDVLKEEIETKYDDESREKTEVTETHYNVETGKIEQVVIIHDYDVRERDIDPDSGNIIEERQYGADFYGIFSGGDDPRGNSERLEVVREYDGENVVVEKYYEEGIQYGEDHYEYDDNGKLSTETAYEDGKMEYKIYYNEDGTRDHIDNYDSEGNVESAEYYNEDGNIERIERNDKTDVVERTTYDEDGNETKFEEIKIENIADSEISKIESAGSSEVDSTNDTESSGEDNISSEEKNEADAGMENEQGDIEDDSSWDSVD